MLRTLGMPEKQDNRSNNRFNHPIVRGFTCLAEHPGGCPCKPGCLSSDFVPGQLLAPQRLQGGPGDSPSLGWSSVFPQGGHCYFGRSSSIFFNFLLFVWWFGWDMQISEWFMWGPYKPDVLCFQVSNITAGRDFKAINNRKLVCEQLGWGEPWFPLHLWFLSSQWGWRALWFLLGSR